MVHSGCERAFTLPPSLEPKCFDRVEARGLPRGVIAEDHADGDRDRDRRDDGGDRRGRWPVGQQSDEHRSGAARRDAHGAAQEAKHNSLNKELAKDIA